MRVHYDDEVDALYLELSDEPPEGVLEITEGVNLDTTSRGKIVGIETLNASKKIDLRTVLCCKLEFDKNLIAQKTACVQTALRMPTIQSTSGPHRDNRAKEVSVTEKLITFHLVNGRIVSVPLPWLWRLSDATPAQRNNFEIIGGGYGVHWPDVDEDLSVEGMLHGVPARRPQK